MTHDVPEDSKVTEGLPLMSVITPTYSGEKLIREAVKSVLAQDSPALEIIVADCYACGAHANQPEPGLREVTPHVWRHSASMTSGRRQSGLNQLHRVKKMLDRKHGIVGWNNHEE